MTCPSYISPSLSLQGSSVRWLPPSAEKFLLNWHRLSFLLITILTFPSQEGTMKVPPTAHTHTPFRSMIQGTFSGPPPNTQRAQDRNTNADPYIMLNT